MVKYEGGNATTKENAVIIIFQDVEYADVVGTEYAWINNVYGKSGVEWKLVRQSLSRDRTIEKKYDTLIIKLKNENELEVWFVITDDYGKR